jgi:hypothetical protein
MNFNRFESSYLTSNAVYTGRNVADSKLPFVIGGRGTREAGWTALSTRTIWTLLAIAENRYSSAFDECSTAVYGDALDAARGLRLSGNDAGQDNTNHHEKDGSQ